MSSDRPPTGAHHPEPRAMHIGEVAARTELSLRSLRHWDEVGLLRPSGRTHGGFRLYTEADVAKIMLIRRMKPLGFTLDQMRTTLRDIEALAGGTTVDGDGSDGSDGPHGARARLAHLLDDAGERRAKLARQLDMADEFIALLATASHEL